MSQQTLINISPGDDADADVIMGNFNYLDEKIGRTQTSMVTLENNVTNTITNTLSIYQDVVQPKDSFNSDAQTVTSGDCYIKSNTIVAFTPTGNVTFHLPSITDNTKFYQILVQVKIDSASYITADNDRLGTDYYFDNIKPTFSIGYYDIIYSYDNIKNKWCVGAILKTEID